MHEPSGKTLNITLTRADNQGALKRQLRADALKARDSIPAPAREARGLEALRLLAGLPEFASAHRVLLYASFRSEVHTLGLIERAVSLGKDVYLPKVNIKDGTLTKHHVNGLKDVCTGYCGIPEPTTDRCVRVEEIGLLVIPGVAFDQAGHRIGYGGGFYDRLLPRIKGTRPIVALAYEEQIFDHVPSEPHDIPMDIIVTDRRVIRCHA